MSLPPDRQGRRRAVRSSVALAAAVLLLAAVALLWVLQPRGSSGAVPEDGLASPRQAPLAELRAPVESQAPPPSRTELGPALASAPPEAGGAPQEPAAPEAAWPLTRGQVVWRGLGVPIEGVRVSTVGHEHGLSRAVTDEDGCFELRSPWELPFLRLERKGAAVEHFWQDDLRDSLWTSCGHVLGMRFGGTVSGRVADEQGQPIRSGRVLALDEEASGFADHGPGLGDPFASVQFYRGVQHVLWYTASAELDEEGRFEIPGVVAEERIRFRVESDGVLPELVGEVRLEQDERREIELRVRTASHVQGSIPPPRFDPPSRICRSRVMFFVANDCHDGDLYAWCWLAEDGSFRSPPLPPSHKVMVSASVDVASGPGTPWVTWWATATTPLSAAETVELRIDAPEWVPYSSGLLWPRDC